MLDLPQSTQGLRWIVAHPPLQLLLMPDVHPASIIAAAAGDERAASYLRWAAHHFVVRGSTDSLTAFDALCLEAAPLTRHHELHDLLQRHEGLRAVYEARMRTTADLLHAAVREGQLDALRWLQALCHRFVDDDADLMQLAARHGHLSILKYIYSLHSPHDMPWDYTVPEAAASHIECLLWLISQDLPCPVQEDVVADVAETGDLDALKRLRAASKLPLELWHERVCIAAANSGNLAMLQYLRQLYPPVPWDSNVTTVAAVRGDLTMLQWVRAQDSPAPWTEGIAAAIAAREGNIPILKWLTMQDPPCPLTSLACSHAAEFGQLETLQWLYPRLPASAWDEKVTSAAAGPSDSNLRVLQWLRSQKPPCPWEVSCTSRAAFYGNLPMLQWIHAQQSCALAPYIPCHAACRGHIPMLEWASLQIGCCLEWTGELYYAAAAGGHIETLRWLHSKGMPAPAPLPDPKTERWLADLAKVSIPILMFLGNIGAPMLPPQQAQLVQARRTFCTFHGLLRWCQRAVSRPGRGLHLAFDELQPASKGQQLLVHLCVLPPELISRIAVAAELQHDISTSPTL